MGDSEELKPVSSKVKDLLDKITVSNVSEDSKGVYVTGSTMRGFSEDEDAEEETSPTLSASSVAPRRIHAGGPGGYATGGMITSGGSYGGTIGTTTGPTFAPTWVGPSTGTLGPAVMPYPEPPGAVPIEPVPEEPEGIDRPMHSLPPKITRKVVIAFMNDKGEVIWGKELKTLDVDIDLSEGLVPRIRVEADLTDYDELQALLEEKKSSKD